MTGYRKVYIDTAPFIYFIDESEVYAEIMERIFSELLNNNVLLVTSVITCEEFLVYPYRVNNQEKIDVFFEFIEECGIQVINIDLYIAKKAAMLRSKYKDIKGMDALQLSTAIVLGCDLFLTNDKQLRQIKEINIITLDEWK